MRRLPAVTLLLVGALIAGCAPARGDAAPSAATTVAPIQASPPEAAPRLVPLKLGLNSSSANIAPMWVAKEEGYFTRYGIDVDLVPIPGGERIVGALVSGEIPLTNLAGTGLVSAALGGADLIFVGSFANHMRHWLYVRPEITAVQQLRGQQLAITGRGGINRRNLELVLQRHGLDPDRDVTLIPMGRSTETVVALLGGIVAGTMLSPPFTFRAEDEGMRMLVDTHEYHYAAVLSGIAVSRAWVAQHADLTRRALQATADGVAFSHRDKERTKQIIAAFTQTDDAELLERTYVAVAPSWEKDLRVPPEAIQNELDGLAAELPAARDAPPEQFYDNRLVDELESAGFFRQLGW